MIKQLADALLQRVYNRVIAVVCMDRLDHVLSVVMLDARFADTDGVANADAEKVIVICSHPDARRVLEEEEIICCRRIAAQTEHAALLLYIYDEDGGLCEVDNSAILGYNGENAI